MPNDLNPPFARLPLLLPSPQTVSTAHTALVVQRNPFGGSVVHARSVAGHSVADIVSMAGLPRMVWPFVRVWVDSEEVPLDMWARVRPREGHTVYVRVMQHGGGGGGKKNPLASILMLVVAVTAMAWGGPLGAAMLGETMAMVPIGATTLGAVVGSAVINLVGNMLIGALIKPPQQQQGAQFDSGPIAPSYALTGSANRAAPYSPIPRVFGAQRVYPVLAAHPYTEAQGGDQYLRLLLTCGYGPVKVSDLKIGNTPLSAYTNVEVEIHEGGPSGWSGNTDITLYTNRVQEDTFSVELTDAGGWVTRNTELNTAEIIVDYTFPGGLVYFTDTGGFDSLTRSIEVEYRLVGDATWIAAPWSNNSDEGFNVYGVITLTKADPASFRVGGRWLTGATGQYEIRSRRMGGIDGTKTSSRSYWSAIRSVQHAPPVMRDDINLIAIRMKASEQLNGIPDTINCLAEAYLPAYNGSTWAYELTRSPAWAYADLLRRRGREARIPDARIDLASIMDWAEACDAAPPNGPGPYWTFDAVIEGGSVYSALRRAAAIGRASFTMKDGKYSIVRDVEQSVPRQHITPRNSWGYSGTKQFIDLPHALRVRFKNEDLGHQEDEITVYDDGYSEENATVFESLELFDCSRSAQAWREGRYFIAVGRLRPEEHSVTMDIENLRCTLGDLVMFAHDVISIGIAQARVKAVTVAGGNVTHVQLDSTLDLEPATTYAIRARLSDGSSLLKTITAVGVQTNTDTLAIAAPQSVATSPAVGDLVMFGQSSLESAPMIIKRIAPGPDLTARVSMVDAQAGVYTADSGTIPAFETYITNDTPAEQRRPNDPVITLRSNEAVVLRHADGSIEDRIAVAIHAPTYSAVAIEWYEMAMRQSDATNWTDLPRLSVQTVEHMLTGVRRGIAYDVRVRSVGANGRTSEWAVVAGHVVVGITTAPGAVENLTAENTTAGAQLRWEQPLESPNLGNYYVRRGGADWDSATEVVSAFSGTSLFVAILTTTPTVFRVKARNKTGEYGPEETVLANATAIDTIDLTVPPTPTGLASNPAIASNILTWLPVVGTNYPSYANPGSTEVWRGTTNDRDAGTTKLLVTVAPGVGIYQDVVGTTATVYYYWIRFVSAEPANVPGAFNAGATAGVAGTTGKVGNSDLNALLVEAGQLADNSVNYNNIINGAVYGPKVAALAIESGHIATGGVTALQLGTSAVEATKIATGAVLQDKLADAAVSVSKLKVSSVGAALNSDPNFEDPTAYWLGVDISGTLPAFATVTDGKVGTSVARSTGSGGSYTFIQDKRIVWIDAAKTYRFRCWARTVSGATGSFYFGFYAVDSAGTHTGGWWTIASDVVPPSGWTLYELQLTGAYLLALSSENRGLRLTAILNYSTGDRIMEVQDFRVEEVITTSLLGPEAVNASKIATDAVTDLKILAGAVTNVKLGDLSVSNDKLQSLAVATANIQPLNITNDLLGTNAVTAAKILAGTITGDRLFANTITAGQMAADSIYAVNIVAGTITGDRIAANEIDAAHLKANSVTADKILAGSITANKLLIASTGSAMNPDPAMQDATQWADISGTGTFVPASGGGYSYASSTAAYWRAMSAQGFQVDPGKVYRLRARIYGGGGGGAAYVRWATMTGANALGVENTTDGTIENIVPPTGEWGSYVGNPFTPTSNRIGIMFYLNWGGSGPGHSITDIRVEEVLPGVMIQDGAITADKIYAGSVTAVKIAAGAVTTEKLLVQGVGSALNSDPDCKDISAWHAYAAAAGYKDGALFTTVTDGAVGKHVIRGTSATCYIVGDPVAYDASRTYRMKAWARSFSATGVLYLGTYAYPTDALAQATPENNYCPGASGGVPTGDGVWREYTMLFGAGTGNPFTSAMKFVRPNVILNYPAANTGYMEAQDVRIEEVLPSTLIKDGAILTDKLAANAVTAAKVATNTLTANEIAAGTITGDRLFAYTITAGQMAANSVVAASIVGSTITGDKVAAATLYGTHIVAGSITADRMLVQSTGGALNADPGCEDQSAWEPYPAYTLAQVAVSTTAKVGRSVLRGGNNTTATAIGKYRIPIAPDKVYRAHCYARSYAADPAAGVLYFGPVTWDNTGTFQGGNWLAASAETLTTSWSLHEATFTAASLYAGAVTMSPCALFSWATTGQMEVCDIRIEEVMQGTLIQDGAITTAKLDVGAVTAGKISTNAIVAGDGVIANAAIEAAQIGSVNATTITTGSLNAGLITAGTLTADRIVANSITTQIADLGITTQKMAANAISNMAFAIGSTSALISPGSYHDVVTLSFTTTGGPLLIQAVCSWRIEATSNYGGQVALQLYRDTTFSTQVEAHTTCTQVGGSESTVFVANGVLVLARRSQPAAGSYTWKVRLVDGPSGGLRYFQRTIVITELKK